EAAGAMIDLLELELAHADAEAERVGLRDRRVERHIAREREQTDEIGSRALRADIERIDAVEADELPVVIEERTRTLQQAFSDVPDLDLIRGLVVQHG